MSTVNPPATPPGSGGTPPSAPPAAPRPDRPYIEQCVWTFSRNADINNNGAIYIAHNTTLAAFKNDKVTDLTFYTSGMTGQPLADAIMIYTNNLHARLLNCGVEPLVAQDSARAAINSVVSDTKKSIQDLLNTVVDNYRETP